MVFKFFICYLKNYVKVEIELALGDAKSLVAKLQLELEQKEKDRLTEEQQRISMEKQESVIRDWAKIHTVCNIQYVTEDA